MPTYSITAPNGRVYSIDGPEGATQEQVVQQILARDPNAGSAPSTQRTLGQSFTDPLLSVGVGLGKLAQLPGQVATLAGATNLGAALSKPGEVGSEYFKSLQSEGLKARQVLSNKAMSEAEKDGVLSEFATAIKQTITDPALLSTFVFEQLPMLLGPQAAATITTKLGAKALQTAATVEAKKLAETALTKKATAAAVGTGATMQGADVGSETYKEALKLLEKQNPEMPPEEREKIALNKGRVAALEAGAISLAAGRLPGASALEKRMAGLPGAGRIKTAAGETAQEILEEGGGKFASNVGLQEIDPTRSLTQGVGTAAGLGAIGGGVLGAALGKGAEPTTPVVAPGAPGAPAQIYGGIDEAVAAKAQADAAKAAEAASKGEVTQTGEPVPPENIPEIADEVAAEGVTPAVPEPTVRKKGAQDVAQPDIVEPGEVAAIEPAGAPAVVPSVGVDSEPYADAAAIQSEAAGVGVPKLPATGGNAVEGITGSTVDVKGVPYTVNAYTDSMISMQNEKGTSLRVMRKGKLGQDIEAQLGIKPVEKAPAPEVEAPEAAAPAVETPAAPAAPTTITPETLAELGINKRAGAYKKIVGKEITDPEVRKVLESYMDNNLVKSESKDKVGVYLKTLEAPAVVEPTAETPTAETPVAVKPNVVESVNSADENEKTVTKYLGTGKNIKLKDGTEVELIWLQDGYADNAIVAVNKQGKPIGEIFFVIDPSGKYQPVSDVNKEYQRKGLATALYDLAEGVGAKFSFEGGVRTKEGQAFREARERAKQAPVTEAPIAEASAVEAPATPNPFGALVQPLKTSEVAALAGKVGAPAKGMPSRDDRMIAQITKQVGIYNAPSTSVEQRYKATNSIYASATDKDTPPRVKQFALQALKGAITNKDMRPELRSKYDALVKGVEEDTSINWGGYKYNVASLDSVVPTTEEFIAAVEKGSTRKALQALLRDENTHPVVKLVVQRILKADTLPKLSVVPEGELGTDPTDPDKYRAGEYNAITDSIRLDARSVNGVNLVHEVVHGFLHRKVVDYMEGGYKDAQIKRIDDLFQFLKTNHTGLAKEYGMTDLSEFTSEVMSNPEFQDALKGIQYKGNSFYSQFAKAVLKFFGITDTTKNWNALAEALISTESAMQSGRAFQEVRTGTKMEGPSTASTYAQDVADIAQQGDMVGKAGERPGLMSKITQLEARVAGVDRYAKIAKILANAYGGLRSAAGRINPEVAIRQAVDAPRVAAAVMQEGTLKFNSFGLGEATELLMADGTKVSTVKVIETMQAYAKQNGVSYEKYDNTVSNVDYGHRVHNLYLRNDDLQAQIVALKAQPTQGKATATKIAELESRKILFPGMDRAVAAAREAMFQASPEYQRIAEMRDTIRFSLIDTMVEAGRITPDLADVWKDATGYIPFDRLNDFESRLMDSGSPAKGLAAISKMHAYVGSERKITSTMDSFTRFVNWATTQSLQNNAAYKAMADMELLGYATRGAKVRHDAPGKDNIFIYENGEKVQYEVPDMSIAVAFMGDPEGALPSIIKAFQKSAQLLRVGVTFVPGFAAKQVTEDMTRAMVFSGVKNPMMLLPRIMYNFPKMSKAGYFGPKLKLVKEMEKLGISGTYSGDITDHIKEVQIEAGVLKRGKLDTFIHYAEVLSKASDIAVRGAIYEQTLAETKSATHPEGDKLLAAHRAREVINFSRRGASKSVDYVSRMAPFVNAQIQGMDKLFQAMGGSEAGTGLSPAKAKTVFWRRAGVMAAASFGYAMMMSGDDEYEKQEDYVKFGSWLLPKMGDLGGVPLGIPVPKELGMFFKVIPEAVVAYYKNHGTLQERDALDLMGAVVRNFGTSMLTVPTPTLAKAVTEWATNYSLFMQRPLESASQQLLEPYARYGNQTSETTKDISKLLYHVGVGISPIHIENLMRNLLGTTAGIMLGVMDKFSNPNAPSRPLDKDLWMQFLGGSAFIQDEVGTRYMQDLYKMNKESTIAHNTLESKIIDDPEGYDKYAEDNKSKLAMYSVTKSLIDDLNKLNDVAKFVRNDKDATPDEKAETLLELRNGAANIAKEVRYLRQTKREIENE